MCATKDMNMNNTILFTICTKRREIRIQLRALVDVDALVVGHGRKTCASTIIGNAPDLVC
jgi:hypothetical protein